LNEILCDPAVVSKLENTKAFNEVKALEEFFNTMKTAPEKAFYGYGHVSFANDQNAVQTLMVTDELFRSSELKERKKYVALVEKVQELGGTCLVFSSAHVSGQQLKKLSGIAAVLRFPVVLEEEEESESSSDESDEDTPVDIKSVPKREEEIEQEEIEETFNFDEFN
jgi:protein pelota